MHRADNCRTASPQRSSCHQNNWSTSLSSLTSCNCAATSHDWAICGKNRTDHRWISGPTARPLRRLLTYYEIQKPGRTRVLSESQKRKPGGQPGYPGKTWPKSVTPWIPILSPAALVSRWGVQAFWESPVAVGVSRWQTDRATDRGGGIPAYVANVPAGVNSWPLGGRYNGAGARPEISDYKHYWCGWKDIIYWNYSKRVDLETTGHQGWVRFKPPIADGRGCSNPCKSLWEWAQQRQHVHVDGLPGQWWASREWLWVAAGKDFCLFHAGGGTRARSELETDAGDWVWPCSVPMISVWPAMRVRHNKMFGASDIFKSDSAWV